MKRSHKSISFVAWKLKLKKYKETYNRARKKNSKEITKDLLLNLYFVKNKSVREIALLLDLGKTTIEHYLKKFDIVKLLQATRNDKKSSFNQVKYILLKKIGSAHIVKKNYSHSVSDKMVRQAFKDVVEEVNYVR